MAGGENDGGRWREGAALHCSLFTAMFLLFFLWPLFIKFATQRKRQLKVASGYLAV